VKHPDEEFRRPESVLVVVYTDDAQILLLKRTKPFEFWQSVTGSLLVGETHSDAAVRELSEETGIVSSDSLWFSGTSRQFTIDERWRHRFAPGTVSNTEFEWRLRLPQAVDVALDLAEHSSYQWLPVDQAIDAVWSWTNKQALEQLQETL
jgi:dATP pyrophosphohydrolase